MALLSVWPENQVFAALFDKLAYGAMSAALNRRNLAGFEVPGRGQVPAEASEGGGKSRVWVPRLRTQPGGDRK